MRPIDKPTSAAKEALDVAHVQFAAMGSTHGHEYPGTEHVLLGLLDSNNYAASKALDYAGFDLDALKEALLEKLAIEGGHPNVEDRAHNLLIIASDEAN